MKSGGTTDSRTFLAKRDATFASFHERMSEVPEERVLVWVMEGLGNGRRYAEAERSEIEAEMKSLTSVQRRDQ